MTAIDNTVCPSCGLPGEPSPALDVCTSCQSAAAERARAELELEGLSAESWLLTDVGLLAEAGAPGRLDTAAGLLALEDIEEITVILDEHELTDYYQSPPELVRHLAAAAAQSEQVRSVLTERGLLDDESDLSAAVHAAVAWTELFPGGLRELEEFTREYARFRDRFVSEREWRVKVAWIAGGLLSRNHDQSHAGDVESCPACAEDLAVIERASSPDTPDC